MKPEGDSPLNQTVFVVDDNLQMRETVRHFLQRAGLAVETFALARAFLDFYQPTMSGCLILDIRMPEMSGLELQELLLSKGPTLPIIIVSGYAQVKDAVQAMKLGSFEFLEKPYPPDYLLERVKEALELDKKTKIANKRLADVRTVFEKLSLREKEIISMVIAGKQSKMIASKINVSVSTVDNHRANIMKKLHAETSADLTRILLQIEPNLGDQFKS